MKKIPIYKVIMNEQDPEQGVHFISLVDDPAIKADWIKLKEDLEDYFLANKDQQMLYGPLLIPDLPIYRNSTKLGEHYIVFTAEQIRLIADRFNKDLNNRNINFMHQNIPVNGFVAENWIVKPKTDSSTGLGFDLKPGTWFGGVKIEDGQFWNEQVKTDKVKGFSVEIKNQLEPMLMNNQLEKNNMNTMEDNKEVTNTGVVVVVEDLAVAPGKVAPATPAADANAPAPADTNKPADNQGALTRDDVAQMIDARFGPLMEEITAIKDYIAKEQQTNPQDTTQANMASESISKEAFEAVELKLKEIEELLNNTTTAVNVMKPQPKPEAKRLSAEEERINYLTENYFKKPEMAKK